MVVSVLASSAVATVLLAAAGSKVADRSGALVGLSTYGIAGCAAVPALLVLVAAEAAIAVGLAVGSPLAAPAGAGVLAAFAVAQGVALLAGHGGAPCGCAGSTGRLSWWSAARTAGLAVACAVIAALPQQRPEWAAAIALSAAAAGAAAVVAWLRGTSVPRSALDVAGEGPDPGSRTPLAGLVPGDGMRLALFTSSACRLCARLRRALPRLASEHGVTAVELDEERDAAAWLAAGVPGSPFAVVVDGDGVVRAKGTVNTRAQLRSLLAAAGSSLAGSERPPEEHAAGGAQSRRRFLERAAGAAAALTAGRAVGALVAPGEAEAYHFCGHIYTTDGCPHPTGLPRIDSRGYPLRARDGGRVDDLGRLVDREGRPVDENGDLLVDADGRPLPPATRTRVCTAAGEQHGIRVRVDGAWYRCCGGHVRKLVDCCSTHPRRINGDRALRGYCYGKRKVFCVMYFQTRVPC